LRGSLGFWDDFAILVKAVAILVNDVVILVTQCAVKDFVTEVLVTLYEFDDALTGLIQAIPSPCFGFRLARASVFKVSPDLVKVMECVLKPTVGHITHVWWLLVVGGN